MKNTILSKELKIIHWCLSEPFNRIHSFKHKFYFPNLVAFTNDIQHLIFLPILPLFFVSVLFLNFMHTTLLLFSILLYFVLHEIVRGCIGRILSSHVPLKEVRNIFALSWILEKGHLAWVQISYGEKFFLYTFHSRSRFYFYFLFGYHNVHTEYIIYEGMKKDAVRDLYYHQLMFNLIRKM